MRPTSSRCPWLPLRAEALLLPLVVVTALAMPPPAVAQDDRLALPADAEATPAGSEELYLQVTLNQSDSDRLVPFMRDNGHLRASVGTLRQIGFALPGRSPEEVIALDDLPGVVVRYDAALQRISLDAPLSLLSLDTTMLNAPQGSAPRADASPGLLLNYDLYASRQRDASNLAATTELRIFGVGSGIFSNSAVTRTYRTRDTGWRGETVRLDSSWQLSFPESAVSLTVGDTFSGFLSWTRPVRMGGVQIGRNFGLQPYRITTPLPAFLGEVAVPSAVELYVNGIQQYSGEVPAGPFQLATVPGITGTGNAQIVVSDAFGRIRTLDFPFYATQQLLAKGLSDWSVSTGVVREDYAIRSFSYASDPVASADLRYGVSDHFTVESHAEGGAGLVNAGAGGRWLLGRAGVASASYAHSTLDGRQGGQTALGYSWNSGRFNVSLDSQRTHGDYRDIASLYGSPPISVSERALAGVTLPAFGTVSASYLRLDRLDSDSTRFAGLFWTQNFSRRWSANLSLNQNLDDSDDRSVFLGVSVALGSRQANVSLQRNRDRDNLVADVSQPVPGDGGGGGIGWRLQARAGDNGGGGLAEIGLVNTVGRYGAGIARFAGDSSGFASASGSLVAMSGRTFAARNIDDAFAVVSTHGIAGVPVRLENRVIGTTDANGMLLVTPLRAWQRNKLSIDSMDLPANLRIDQVELTATPRDRSGIGVRFGIAPVRAAVVVLHDSSGQPLPLGSSVRVEDQEGSGAVVGYDGETYLDSLNDRNRLHVLTPAGACNASLDFVATAEAIPRIGPLTCEMETSP